MALFNNWGDFVNHEGGYHSDISFLFELTEDQHRLIPSIITPTTEEICFRCPRKTVYLFLPEWTKKVTVNASKCYVAPNYVQHLELQKVDYIEFNFPHLTHLKVFNCNLKVIPLLRNILYIELRVKPNLRSTLTKLFGRVKLYISNLESSVEYEVLAWWEKEFGGCFYGNIFTSKVGFSPLHQQVMVLTKVLPNELVRLVKFALIPRNAKFDEIN